MGSTRIFMDPVLLLVESDIQRPEQVGQEAWNMIPAAIWQRLDFVSQAGGLSSFKNT